MASKHTSIEIARMTFKLEFGSYTPSGETNPNTGENILEFAPQFKKWAGLWNLTQTEQLTLAGAGIKDAVVFFVRHDKNITSDLTIRRGEKLYTIDNINYDDGLTADSFDLITCHHEVTKHG
ncbi:phage head closure protein [Lactobacillus mulieris]|uniref:Phage head closure protein n=1 Tax=Lactobacillus mulieris TaxID=2508708 RepID=A0AAP3M3V8_9LACO|nr:phage head closure protein [Lactobacillus mulieris]MCW8123453.1 phage head closure protein [Lactobacillus mulieris]MCZ3844163.1 phage head closure protein [Lactobacillus mulieris]MCZ3875823.1 phage head closure protein [Lactobacillus mulieris]MDK7326616.1 phage head closure protein [Lactobacillus mulieris]WEB30138.1 phage head closure protein [Lactobacillus mulieris]